MANKNANYLIYDLHNTKKVIDQECVKIASKMKSISLPGNTLFYQIFIIKELMR